MQGKLNPDTVTALKNELDELKSREWITNNKKGLLDDIAIRESQKTIGEVRKQCSTRNISAFAGELSRTEIVEKMRNSFESELSLLKAGNQKLNYSSRTKAGRSIQELSLEGTSSSIRTSQVLSEGEQKIAALADFFAVLDVSPGNSTVVLDDPVTSLDHKWRKSAAERIVQEAERRPVIIFTHEPRFCGYLSSFADKNSVSVAFRTVTCKGDEAGKVLNDLSWDASNTSDRIKALHKDVNSIRKEYKNGTIVTDDALTIRLRSEYDLLRAAWERAVEEVLLNETVQRFEPPIQTKRVKKLCDISLDDYEILDAQMSRCSTMTAAHDDAMIAPDESPTIKELEDDINTLAKWIKGIRDRRK